ncbi:hypothetical protein P378_20870 [Desulforamulus profundi]|uniref:Uncharacterized protein n=1 Tax=Desulforamulus profundi TaxID=1383067 RepID=A0A2C6MBX3_9FIRM|nr:hypothetical protein P378_20870 [Desulforamulus profundi]
MRNAGNNIFLYTIHYAKRQITGVFANAAGLKIFQELNTPVRENG